jgi:hypothetical protein
MDLGGLQVEPSFAFGLGAIHGTPRYSDIEPVAILPTVFAIHHPLSKKVAVFTEATQVG